MARIVVVGGGISGLAVALGLEGHDVTVLEAGAEAGGHARSILDDGRVIDVGPTGWLEGEPAMDRTVEKLGLTPIAARPGERWIYAGGRLHPAPLGPRALLASRLLTMGEKLRLVGEIFVPRGGGPEETVGGFAARRLGSRAVDRLVGPMVNGIFACDPDDLSLRAAFPRMAELERDHRSLILAMIKLGRGGAPGGRMMTLPGGVGALTAAMAARCDVRTGRGVDGMSRVGAGFSVAGIAADAVVLAVPAPAQAAIVRDLAPEAADALDAIPYTPVAVVVTGWPEGAFPVAPRGFGALVARGEDAGVLGTLFTSELVPQHAKPGEILLRTLIGGSRDGAAVGLDEQALVGRAIAAHGRFFGAPRTGPTCVRVIRHGRAIPRYAPGHLDKVARIRAAEGAIPGLFFAGNHLEGVGLRDIMKNAEKTAGKVRAFLGG